MISAFVGVQIDKTLEFGGFVGVQIDKTLEIGGFVGLKKSIDPWNYFKIKPPKINI